MGGKAPHTPLFFFSFWAGGRMRRRKRSDEEEDEDEAEGGVHPKGPMRRAGPRGADREEEERGAKKK